jgi:drug/metabolite transporter (DMT)-like permease
MEQKHVYYHLIAILTVVIWGMTFISTKVLINQGLTPQEIFLYRFLIAYGGIWLISPRRLITNNWKDELWMVAGGAFGGSLYFFAENTALGITQASNVSFLVCTAPLLTMILSLIFYKDEKASKGLIYGSLLALAGVGLVVFSGSVILKISPAGDLLTLCAALSWAFYSLIIRKMAGRYSTVFITRKIFFYGVLTILPVFFFCPVQPNFTLLLKPIVFLNLLFLAVLASLICYVLWNIVLKQLGTMKASNYIYLNPLVTMIASVLILNEQITLITLVGAGCIVLGVYLAEKK